MQNMFNITRYNFTFGNTNLHTFIFFREKKGNDLFQCNLHRMLENERKLKVLENCLPCPTPMCCVYLLSSPLQQVIIK